MMRAVLFLAVVGCASAEPVTYTQVHDEVLVPSCGFSSCHGGANGQGNLEINGSDEDYAAIVEGVSDVAGGLAFVVPGDPDGSYLVQKCRGDDGIVDDVMPPGVGLEAEPLALLVGWIEAGALRE
jgi:hypothetical protein